MYQSTRVFPFVAMLGAAACGGSTAVRPEVAPAFPPASSGPREQSPGQQVTQLLNRLTFGARPGDVDRVREMGVDRWIAWQLQPERIDDDAAERFFAGFESYHLSAAELQQRYPPRNQLLKRVGARDDGGRLSPEDSALVKQAAAGVRRITTEVQGGRVARALLTERQLQEVMTDFWLNHFSVYIQKNQQERYRLAEYENTAIRPNALGKFRTLLVAVAKSPAMLMYLDNALSQADSGRPRLLDGRGRGGRPLLAAKRTAGLNENYGRELLELHTLGVDGGYSQADVINVARALTGWTVQPPQLGGGFMFAPAMHDAATKVVLGHTLRAGRGLEDGEEVLSIVSRHPATARYIAFKLARRFVSDDPPRQLVERAAETFRRTDGDIREVVRTIVTSPEFFAAASYKSKVKSPFEMVTSTLRALTAQPDTTLRTAQMVATLGQPIYGHQAPNGWPEAGTEWMNTGAILNRINFGALVGTNGLPGASPTQWPGAAALQGLPLELQVDGVIIALLGGEASAETRAILTRGENPLLRTAATTTMTAPVVATAGSDMAAPEPLRHVTLGSHAPLKGLAGLVGLAIGSPEFQRR